MVGVYILKFGPRSARFGGFYLCQFIKVLDNIFVLYTKVVCRPVNEAKERHLGKSQKNNGFFVHSGTAVAGFFDWFN